MDATDPTSIAQIITWVRDLGTIGLLTFAILAGFRGWVLTKREVDQRATDAQLRFDDERADKTAALAERDEWKALALELLQTTKRAASIAEKAVG